MEAGERGNIRQSHGSAARHSSVLVLLWRSPRASPPTTVTSIDIVVVGDRGVTAAANDSLDLDNDFDAEEST
ncbi:hypothetical protein H498_11258 [Cutibacterium acnes P6]|nr:hypothetical protein H498_11258 [Cutibacterium acnes P6]MCM4186256.1 hypothetical protein [Cutibacterium acnes P10]